MSARHRRRQREAGLAKLPNESKATAEDRGVPVADNESKPWRQPLRRVLGRTRYELRKAGYLDG